MASQFKRTNRFFALGATTLILTAQTCPFAAQAQADGNSGLPSAILGEVEGNKSSTTTTTPTPTPAPVQPSAPETAEPGKEKTVEPAPKPESASAHLGSPERPHTGLIEEKARAAAPAPQAAKKPIMLYGRLEEISGSATPQFPIVLKALTPKMGQLQVLKGQATTGTLAGTAERSYPADFRGTWGGQLTMGQLVIAPLNYQIDPDDARKTASLVRQGAVGTANFVFNSDRAGNIAVEPTQIIFMVPANQTNSFQIAMQQAGGASGMANNAMAGMMQSMMGNMQVPIAIKFGNFQSSAATPSISGNSFSIGVLSNRLKQLSPGIMEQQVITRENVRVARTGATYSTYNENVFRFTQRGASQMYVEVASVSYDMSRRFLRKMVLYGYINKGAVQQDFSNPYSGLQQMMGGGSGGMQMPGMGGSGSGNPLQQLQDLQKMFGGQ